MPSDLRFLFLLVMSRLFVCHGVSPRSLSFGWHVAAPAGLTATSSTVTLMVSPR